MYILYLATSLLFIIFALYLVSKIQRILLRFLPIIYAETEKASCPIYNPNIFEFCISSKTNQPVRKIQHVLIHSWVYV